MNLSGMGEQKEGLRYSRPFNIYGWKFGASSWLLEECVACWRCGRGMAQSFGSKTIRLMDHNQVYRRKLKGCIYLLMVFLPSLEYELLDKLGSTFQAISGFQLLSVLSLVFVCLFVLSSGLHAC